MRSNPYFNAICAVVYIGAVASFMQFISSMRANTPDTFLDGMGALSLFVFSAAIMALLFFYQPAILLIEGKKKEALSYFSKMVVTFGVITVLLLALVSLQ